MILLYSQWNGIAQWLGITSEDELDFILPNRGMFGNLFSSQDLFKSVSNPPNPPSGPPGPSPPSTSPPPPGGEPVLTIVGDDWVPESAFPLGMCEGDVSTRDCSLLLLVCLDVQILQSCSPSSVITIHNVSFH